jgi:hypothetical protein
LKLRFKILLVLVFLSILGAIVLLPHDGYRREVEAYKQQLIARGEKLTIAELAPPPYTNESNGAKAFLDLVASYRAPYQLVTAARSVVPGLAQIGFTNQTADLTSNYAYNCQFMAQVRNMLDTSDINFNLDYSDLNASASYLSRLKSSGSLAHLTTMQALHAGDFTEARADLLAAVHIICLSNDPSIISGLVRTGMAQAAICMTWEALQTNAWTDPQLAELQNAWQKLDLFSNVPASLVLDRAYMIKELADDRQSFRMYLNGLGMRPITTTFSAKPPKNGPLDRFQGSLKNAITRVDFWRWKNSWSYAEELSFLQEATNALGLAAQVNATGAFVPAFSRYQQQLDVIAGWYPDATNHFLLSTPTGDSFGRTLKRFAIAENAHRLCVTAIALKRYRLQHGAYPEKLDELVPDLLSSVLIDFMDGKPLRYGLRPDGDYILYSVGEDGVDDGGDPRLPPSTGTSSILYMGRDIVWPRVATAAALAEHYQHAQTATNAPDK